MNENHDLKSDFYKLRLENEGLNDKLMKLNANIQLLELHNEEKNREI